MVNGILVGFRFGLDLDLAIYSCLWIVCLFDLYGTSMDSFVRRIIRLYMAEYIEKSNVETGAEIIHDSTFTCRYNFLPHDVTSCRYIKAPITTTLRSVLQCVAWS